MDIVLPRSAVAEWGVLGPDDELDALGFGLTYLDSEPIHRLMVQMEAEGSDLAEVSMGLCVEIDGSTSHTGIGEFSYDAQEDRVRLALDEDAHGIRVLQAEIPRPVSPEQRRVLQAIQASHRDYLRRQAVQSARTLALLAARFAPLPPDVVARVQAASLFELKDIGMDIPSARSLEDIFRYRRR
jgi:hypothetical protein